MDASTDPQGGGDGNSMDPKYLLYLTREILDPVCPPLRPLLGSLAGEPEASVDASSPHSPGARDVASSPRAEVDPGVEAARKVLDEGEEGSMGKDDPIQEVESKIESSIDGAGDSSAQTVEAVEPILAAREITPGEVVEESGARKEDGLKEDDSDDIKDGFVSAKASLDAGKGVSVGRQRSASVGVGQVPEAGGLNRPRAMVSIPTPSSRAQIV